MLNHVLFSNSPHGTRDFTINFFYENAAAAKTAQLACPFFSTVDPLAILKQNGCGRIRLLVRLCAITTPEALVAARQLDEVQIRYFTAESFHAKFYILGNVALVGSANMTGAGLTSNRELSVVVRGSEEWFDEIPSIFEDLWNRASVLTEDVLARFKSWHRTSRPPSGSEDIAGIDSVAPETVNVASKAIGKVRAYLESYRRDYYEIFIPNYREVRTWYESLGHRHSDFENHSMEYEIDRFLSWTKLTFTTDDALLSNPIRRGAELSENVVRHIQKWMDSSQRIDSIRVDRLSKLKSAFSSEAELNALGFGDLTDALLGCAAFDEQLRFTKGGKQELVKAFQADNKIDQVRKTFSHLAFGPEEFVQRTYDCIYSTEYKLAHFSRSCIMELFGWTNNEDVPPLNMRAVKALRYLGFDVPT